MLKILVTKSKDPDPEGSFGPPRRGDMDDYLYQQHSDLIYSKAHYL